MSGRKKRSATAKRLITRGALLTAIEHTYDDSEFLIQKAVDPNGDFREGLCMNRSSFVSKKVLRELVRQTDATVFSTVPEFPNDLILDSKTSLWTESIEQNQIFITEVPEDYQHVVCKSDHHWEVYFKIDHEEKTISILLGTYMKKLKLKEHTDYVWKPEESIMSCANSESLERTLLDSFWADTAIGVLRLALGIPKAL